MRVLVCPDKFRGTLTAAQAAAAIGRGWARVRPQDAIDLMPLADGGEGTLDALLPLADADTTGSRRVAAVVPGPLGDPVDAAVGVRGGTGVVELASASGIGLVPPERRDPRRTTTAGTGALMRALLDEDIDRLFVCLGGSATNDGGVGIARALGVSFADVHGVEVPEGGEALLDLARIDTSGLDRRLGSVDVLGLTDVDNPLCGPRGASAAFGPQKGASDEDVWVLDRALGHLAAVVHRDLGIDVRDEPGAGAAGGTGFGLLAFCGARLRPGIEVVMESVGFEPALGAADLVVTGEGSLDVGSLHGKVPSGVLEAAGLARTPVAIVCGRACIRLEGALVRSLEERVGPTRAMQDAERSVELVAGELAGELGR